MQKPRNETKGNRSVGVRKGEVEEEEWGMAAGIDFPGLAANLGAGLEV